MADDEGLSIEETNKLRLSLGLKPLNVGSAQTAPTSQLKAALITSEQQDVNAVANYKRKQESEKATVSANANLSRLQKLREKTARNVRLSGLTLGDAAEDEGDTLSWIREHQLRKKQGSPVVEPVTQAQTRKDTLPEYSSAELTGMRVAHNMEDFSEGADVILTLGDGDVLSGDQPDELVNANMSEQDRLKMQLKLKKRKSPYVGHDDEEHVDPETGAKKLLSHYDDAANGPAKESGFALSSDPLQMKEAGKSVVTQTRGSQIPISLLSSSDAPRVSSDYAEPVPMKKRKRNKQTGSHVRRRDIREVPITLAEDSREAPYTRQVPDRQSTSLAIDDAENDELQAALTRQRRLAAQRAALAAREQAMTAARIKQDVTEVPAMPAHENGLIFDETTEFARGLLDIKPPSPGRNIKAEQSNADVEMGERPKSQSTPFVKEESTSEQQPPNKISTTGIEEETSLDNGIGAAIGVLRQKGAIKQSDSEASLRQQKEAWLTNDRKIRLELEMERQRVRDELRNSPRFRNMSTREREAYAASENRRLDAKEAKLTQDRFRDYKPNIDIKYVDDFGRNMSQKEAFKHMSHQFHGKNSGSGKTAKKLAQVEKEKLIEQKSLFK